MSYPTEQPGAPAHEMESQRIHSLPPDYNQPNGDFNEKGMPQQIPQRAAPPRNNYQMATPLPSLQQSPVPVDCPVCRVREMTRVEFVSGGTTHLTAVLCCLCLCLGCVPYLANWFKDCEHRCGNCGELLAVWHRSGRTEVLAHPTA